MRETGLNDESTSLLDLIERLIKATYDDATSSNIIFAALFSQLNYWATNHMPFYKECMEPVVLIDETPGTSAVFGVSAI